MLWPLSPKAPFEDATNTLLVLSMWLYDIVLKEEEAVFVSGKGAGG
jgi:hypothetical protein